VDDGAKRALREGGKSLLPPGIARLKANLLVNVRICDLNGTEFVRGFQSSIRGRLPAANSLALRLCIATIWLCCDQ
jgi:hypothetical protein